MSSSKLRQLIRDVRACKTAAEERKVVTSECASIRTSFKNNDEHSRARNLAKLLYIHMLGYPSHFGQMECVKLLASPVFADKRIGYLGLTLMLQEVDEVLMLATNSLKVDLNSDNKFVVGMSLAAIGNLATPDMARDLASEVDKHLKGKLPYLRKKAALTTMRVLRKCPELIDDFVERVGSLLKDRSHGVLLSGLRLMITVIELEAEQAQAFAHLVPSLVRMLKHLLTSGYTAEHDVAGITDPFVQVSLLRLLRLFGLHTDGASEQMNDILAQVATTTESAKNAGNSVLYECVRTIMSVESEQGLRLMAVNILGRFLLNRDNNMRYVALNTLSQVIQFDVASVARHRSTIVDCLKDPDVSIRSRATHLIFELINESNVASLVLELLNYLPIAQVEQRRELCSNILTVVQKHSLSPRWRIDTLLNMLSLASDQCDEGVAAATIIYVTQASDLHAYAVHKTMRLLEADATHRSLATVATWCIGEYGELLLVACPPPKDKGGSLGAEESANGDNHTDKGQDNNSNSNNSKGFEGFEGLPGGPGSGSDGYPPVTSVEVIDLLEKVLLSIHALPVVKGYVLTALTKLAPKISAEGGVVAQRMEGLVGLFRGSIQLELQSRSCEYSLLLKTHKGDVSAQVLDKMPVLEESAMALKAARRARSQDKRNGGEDHDGDDDDDDNEDDNEDGYGHGKRKGRGAGGGGGGGGLGLEPPTGGGGGGSYDLFGGVAGGGVGASGAGAGAAPLGGGADLLDLDDLFGGGGGGGAERGGSLRH